MDGGRVERVLRDGYHDGIITISQDGIENETDADRGAICEEDVIWISWVAISLFDEFSDFFTDSWRATGVGVGSDGVGQGGVDFFGASNGICWEELADLGVVEEEGGGDEGEDLAGEGDWFLAQLVRVADCNNSKRVEGEGN